MRQRWRLTPLAPHPTRGSRLHADRRDAPETAERDNDVAERSHQVSRQPRGVPAGAGEHDADEVGRRGDRTDA